MSEWFEDESFWTELYPFMFPEARFESAAENVEKLIRLAEVEDGAALDLCCGPGRYAVLLAERGLTVTGVDRTPFLLDKARKRAAAANVTVEWVQEDMRNFIRPGAFDLVINMFTSFGYFDDKDEDIAVLRNVHQSLKPGGVFLMDTMGKERLARIFHRTTADELDDDTLLVQRHEIFDDWTRIRNEWILINGDSVRTFRFHHTIYSGQELKDRMRGVGFSDVSLYGDLEGNEYGPDAARLIAVARKP